MGNKNKIQTKKISWGRLFVKGIEEGVKKVIELAILGLAIGATMKLVLATIPAVMVGTMFAKIIKVGVLRQ
ncbi:MAG: hypothetical protein ABIF18_02030 [archaeon]